MVLRDDRQQLSRRDLLLALGTAPFLLRPAPLFGLSSLSPSPGEADQSEPPWLEARYTPHYPVRSPLEDVLRLVTPGLDGYGTEVYAEELTRLLRQWSETLERGEVAELTQFFDESVQSCSLGHASETTLRSGEGIRSVHREFTSTLASGTDHLRQGLNQWIGDETHIEYAEFEITSLREIEGTPLTLRSQVRYNVVAHGLHAQREQRVGSWQIDWKRREETNGASDWKVTRWQAAPETRSSTSGPGFEDVTQAALGGTPSYQAQMLRGTDYWRTVLDGACGIDVYGNNGVAAGDFDNDGLDDLYICQPAGLPNRLYRNNGNGTFDDVTDRAGVGVLDNTACALFADLRNSGLQDLLVVCGTGPLLFINQGNGTFLLKKDAFQFARPAEGTFTHAAIADYDRDGRLDIYFCLYSYYLGLDQYHYPTPYFDARNGPPNFLFHNEGDGRFMDRTEQAGLNAENNRYSFSCAWGNSGLNAAPDLYVVNDFGRNNLYRSRGDGTFQESSSAAKVEDVGAGMSACWTDCNNDGRPDLYVANMWSAAGQRVSEEKRFHEQAPQDIRELYQRHARGNALYLNKGNGLFANTAEEAGVEAGRWAWSSDAWDFDHDGYPDLYVANGYITAPNRIQTQSDPTPHSSEAPSNGAQVTDLASFFWRQVVGRSPEDATPSLAYEHGWNALNELIRSDHSWSGSERNAMFVNNRDGSFAEVSGAIGLDFLEDGRAFALADLDQDGRLEVIVKSRNAPQLRILRNAMEGLGHSIAFRLRGTKSNRDAIGASITVSTGNLVQTRYLQAGSGFLSQHSKEIFVGLGSSGAPIRATVHWPSGLTQSFEGLPLNSRITLTEGVTTFIATPFAPRKTADLLPRTTRSSTVRESPTSDIGTWMIDPLKAPSFTLPDLAGSLQTLDATKGRFTLLHFWASTAPRWRDQLRSLTPAHASASGESLNILAINIDQPSSREEAIRLVKEERLPYTVLLATQEIAGIYNLVFRFLFDRRQDLGLPTSFLLDADRNIVKIYQGSVRSADLLADLRMVPTTRSGRLAKALPFPGTLHQGEFARNDFTYGVAMFQHGYLEQAEASFQEVIAARPNDPEAYYNLGTLSLRRNNYARARQYLEQTLRLKPDYPEAWNNLGMMAAQEGRGEEAIQSFRRSLALRPDYSTALLNLGNVYRRQRAFFEAQTCLRRALSLQPEDPEINYSLGMLLAQQNDLQAATNFLETAIALRPSYPEARNNLGVLLIRLENYMDAESQFRDCIRLTPEFEQSYLNLARLYMAQRDQAKARATLQDLLRLNPESKIAQSGLQALDAPQ